MPPSENQLWDLIDQLLAREVALLTEIGYPLFFQHTLRKISEHTPPHWQNSFTKNVYFFLGFGYHGGPSVTYTK